MKRLLLFTSVIKANSCKNVMHTALREGEYKAHQVKYKYARELWTAGLDKRHAVPGRGRALAGGQVEGAGPWGQRRRSRRV